MEATDTGRVHEIGDMTSASPVIMLTPEYALLAWLLGRDPTAASCPAGGSCPAAKKSPQLYSAIAQRGLTAGRARYIARLGP